jgi:hypothetical protein
VFFVVIFVLVAALLRCVLCGFLIKGLITGGRLLWTEKKKRREKDG